MQLRGSNRGVIARREVKGAMRIDKTWLRMRSSEVHRRRGSCLQVALSWSRTVGAQASPYRSCSAQTSCRCTWGSHSRRSTVGGPVGRVRPVCASDATFAIEPKRFWAGSTASVLETSDSQPCDAESGGRRAAEQGGESWPTLNGGGRIGGGPDIAGRMATSAPRRSRVVMTRRRGWRPSRLRRCAAIGLTRRPRA